MLFFWKKKKCLSVSLYEKSFIGGRPENQDYCGSAIRESKDEYCFVIADGLGGHHGGRQAATLAVEIIINRLSDVSEVNVAKTIEKAILQAHEEIKKQGDSGTEFEGMKSTCVVLVVLKGKAYWATVGDSRLYLFRDNQIIQKTKDDSVVQMLLDLGEITPQEAHRHSDRNTVLKSLGTSAELTPSIQSGGVKLLSEDYFLLCTDGLWENFTDQELCEFFERNSHLDGSDKFEKLFTEAIHLAKESQENFDNMTAQLVVVR